MPLSVAVLGSQKLQIVLELVIQAVVSPDDSGRLEDQPTPGSQYHGGVGPDKEGCREF